MPPTAPQVLRPRCGPATLKARPWAGHRLAKLYGRDAAIGESWEFSTVTDSESLTDLGPLGDALGRPLPFLAKLLDTRAPLSIQVHPADDPATGRRGKEETWIVLDADADAVVLAGIRADVNRDTFERAARAAAERVDAGDRLVACLASTKVTAGTVILVPAGTVHAVGGGIFLAEIQQASDCTYRLFDHGRGRPLHLAEALAATKIRAVPQIWQPGDVPRRLSGRHLDIDVLGPGRHKLARLGSDTLMVPTIGTCRLAGADSGETETLRSAQLRLCTRGPITIDVDRGGLVVLGSLPRPFRPTPSD
ncbi:MAG: type I phosphomannose isomerase catalytic subunit [Nannocystaceae bacterium]